MYFVGMRKEMTVHSCSNAEEEDTRFAAITT
jgi:hypothetical protein